MGRGRDGETNTQPSGGRLLSLSLHLSVFFYRNANRFQLLGRHLCRHGKIAISDDVPLALSAVNVLDEFAPQRIQFAARPVIDRQVEGSRQRIIAAVGVLWRRRDGLLSLRGGKGYGPHSGSFIANAAVYDSKLVRRDALHHRRASRLLLHRVLEISLAEGVLLEEAIGARGGIAAVHANRFMSKLALQSELAPRANVRRVVKSAVDRKDGVDLRQRQRIKRVVLVH